MRLQNPGRRPLWQAGLLAIVGSVVANLIVRAIALALLDLPTDFPPLQAGSITFFTVVGTLGAVIVYAIIQGRSEQPARTFQIVAAVALVLSALPNVALAINPSAAPFPGGTSSAFIVLMLFHVVAAVVSVGALTRFNA